MADFFPRSQAKLLPWLKNFCAALTEGAQKFGIQADVVSGLTTKVAAYEVAYTAATGENGTKALIIEKNEKMGAAKTEVRNIKNKYLDYNDAVTNADRERLGLPPRDLHHTPKPAPTSRPTLEVLPTNNRQHTATAINQATGKKTKPADAYGVRYAWEIRDTAPANAEDLRYTIFRRRTTEVFDYNEEDRGKRVFYVACYENAKGDKGKWSDIVEAVIP